VDEFVRKGNSVLLTIFFCFDTLKFMKEIAHKDIPVRSSKDGGWYWIDKTVLHIFGKKIKASGVAVYNVLAYFANSKTQICFPTQKTIAGLIGLSRRTVARKIKTLEKSGLILVEKKRGRMLYYLVKTIKKPGANLTQGCAKKNIRDVTPWHTNKNKLTRINNIDIVDKPISFDGFSPKTKEELLALDLANALNDYQGLPLYLSYAKKYPESLLRQVLGEVKEIPLEKIKKSRGALFNHLVRKYAEKPRP